MGTPAQIGKQQYNAALSDARQANVNLRRILRRVMDESSSQLIRSLVGQMALELADNDAALNQLDEIGRTIKSTSMGER